LRGTPDLTLDAKKQRGDGSAALLLTCESIPNEAEAQL
jgi:hypothetical protein